MKYTIRQQPPSACHVLYRHNDIAIPNNGRPTNAEIEFWYEIERLREENKQKKELLRKILDEISVNPFDPAPVEEPGPDGPWLPPRLVSEIYEVLK